MAKALRSCFCGLSFILGLLLLSSSLGSEALTSKSILNCQTNPKPNNKTTRIGVVFDSGSQLGKQQMVAMKMGLSHFHLSSSCLKLELLLHDSHQNLTSPPSSGNLLLFLFMSIIATTCYLSSLSTRVYLQEL